MRVKEISTHDNLINRITAAALQETRIRMKEARLKHGIFYLFTTTDSELHIWIIFE